MPRVCSFHRLSRTVVLVEKRLSLFRTPYARRKGRIVLAPDHGRRRGRFKFTGIDVTTACHAVNVLIARCGAGGVGCRTGRRHGLALAFGQTFLSFHSGSGRSLGTAMALRSSSDCSGKPDVLHPSTSKRLHSNQSVDATGGYANNSISCGWHTSGSRF
jgi:hypothetical protein